MFIEPHLRGEFGRIVSQNRIGDEGVVQSDEIAARAVKRVGESSGFARKCPTRFADRLRAIVREIFERAMVQDLSVREVTRKERELFANPID